MAWQRISNWEGKLFVPDGEHDGEHACPDCFACQHCSAERCRVCQEKKQTEIPNSADNG